MDSEYRVPLTDLLAIGGTVDGETHVTDSHATGSHGGGLTDSELEILAVRAENLATGLTHQASKLFAEAWTIHMREHDDAEGRNVFPDLDVGRLRARLAILGGAQADVLRHEHGFPLRGYEELGPAERAG
jgi:hypothetical protein